MFDSSSTSGNQIQSISITQSGGAPTNQIGTVQPQRTNVARASNGATASASSEYSSAFLAGGVNDGDRRGTNWGNGGGWKDNTANTYPDWIQVAFNGSKTINEIDVFTLQDNWTSPSEPTEEMTFSQFGITDYQVQYWNGSSWQTISGGSVSSNHKVWNKFTFSNITTDKIRLNITGSLGSGYCRVTEIEAYQSTSGAVTYSYDSAGNVTDDGSHTYAYDSANRIVNVDGGSSASNAYDEQNRRYKKTVGSTVTHYVWQDSQVLAEHNGTNGSVLIDYVYSGKSMIAKVESGNVRYFLSDRLSARLMLDSSGGVIGRQGHLPFGDDFGESGSQEKHHFTNYSRESETGYDNAVNRYDLPNQGRFNSVDQGPPRWADPQGLNRYTYCKNNPVNMVDPLGLWCQQWLHIEYWLTYEGMVIDWGATYTYWICYPDAPSQGGGSGSSGQAQVPAQKNYRQLRKDFRDFLQNLSGDCEHALTNYLPNIYSALSSVTFYDLDATLPDGTLLWQQPAWVYVGPDGDGDNLAEWFLRQWNHAPVDNKAITFEPSSGVPHPGIYFFGDRTTFEGENMYFLLHEMMHYSTGASDADLVTDLGITIRNGETASDALSRWFNNHCSDQ